MAMALEHQFILFLNMNRYAPFSSSEPRCFGKFHRKTRSGALARSCTIMAYTKETFDESILVRRFDIIQRRT
jgi:hypothetical protein